MSTKIPILSVYDENGNRIEVPAIRGKSAYQYAKDGGFTGTEEEFAEKQAQEIPTSLPASDVYAWAKEPNKPSYTANEVGALPSSTKIPSKTSELTNDSGFIKEYIETDPTVPAWAKAASKPSYTKSEIGLGNVDNVKQYSASNPPPYPVTSVNGKTGAVSLDASDVGAATIEQVNQLSEEIADLKAQDTKPSPSYPEGNTVEEQLAWLTENGDTSKTYLLADGYLYQWLCVEIEPTAPTNQLPISTDTDRTTIFNGKGYLSGKRLSSSSGGVSDANGTSCCVSGFIPASVGDTVTIEGLDGSKKPGWDCYLMAFDSTNTKTGAVKIGSEAFSEYSCTLDAATFGATFNAIRFSGVITDNTVVYIDKGESTGTTTNYMWANSGQMFSPDTSDDRITQMESDIRDLKAKNVQQTPLYPEGDTVEEQLIWLAENGDDSKIYLLADGFLYCWQMTKEEITVEGYKNWLPVATETYNGNTVYGEKGYVTGYRLSGSSGSVSAQSGMLTTGFIPATDGAIIRTVGFTAQGCTMGCNVVSYNASGTRIANYQWGTGATYATDDIYISNFTLDSATYGTGIAYIRISASDNLNPEIVTVNQEIKEGGGVTIVEEYKWANTGRAFVPADYEDRIVQLENKMGSPNQSASGSSLSVAQVFAPSPQLPADGTETADFNAATVTAEGIYAYIDELVAKYPKYITKEILGKDESGNHDWCRYTLCRRYYDAWQKVNYPKMYAWVNESTTIYSVSVSPRINDTMYSTKYIGTPYKEVTAVNTLKQTRTVNGLVFTRNAEADISPTLVYTETGYSPYFVGGYAGLNNAVYGAGKSKISTISIYTGDTMTDIDGNSYIRYPLGDRDNKFKDIPAIVIGSNEHGRIKESSGLGVGGDPATPAIISARMIKDLCECKNANNPFINLLKNNYKLVFCPVINPWGLSDAALNRTDTYKGYGGYVNSNDVNLDRNFDTPGWGNDTDVRHGAYGGSENETQYFMNTLAESGAKIAMANHGLGTQVNPTTGEATNAGLCHYMFGRVNSKYNDILTSTGAVMEANYNLVYTSYPEAKPEECAKTRSYIDWIGAEGGAVEMQSRDGFIQAEEGQEYTARIMEANYTLLLQFLHMIMDKQQ